MSPCDLKRNTFSFSQFLRKLNKNGNTFFLWLLQRLNEPKYYAYMRHDSNTSWSLLLGQHVLNDDKVHSSRHCGRLSLGNAEVGKTLPLTLRRFLIFSLIKFKLWYTSLRLTELPFETERSWGTRVVLNNPIRLGLML